MAHSLRLDRVTVTFHRAREAVRALDDVSLVAEAGEYITVVGANGAGKSTLVSVIAGSVLPNSGEVWLGVNDVTRRPDFERAGWVGRVFQAPMMGTCAGLSVKENLALATLRGRRCSPFRLAVDRSRLDRFRSLLAEYGRGLERRLDEDVARLSGGERQLLAVIMAVMERPAVLLFDEHTAALDPHMGATVMQRTDEIVREHGLTTVMITHNMRYAAQYGDRLLTMSRGRIVDDVPKAEKDHLDEEQLIARFRRHLVGEVTDQLLG